MSREPIVRFEHEKLILNQKNKEERELFERLQKYSGHEGSPYFTLIHNGVKFNQHVGVIQVGRTTIEVLPKTDKATEDEEIWKNILIQILRITSGIEASATSKSNLKLHSNSIFDLYIELFIKECEKLTHQGLAKKYRKVQENQPALKGRLHLPGQIRDNLIHKERFHVEYSKYDQNHLINQILKKTLSVLTRIPIRLDLRSRVRRQLLYFDDIGDCAVYEQLFNNIHLNRKTDRYSKALEIARLILLNYHPDISRGANHVLALMFDMNQLWERFITKMIRKDLSDIYQVKAQNKMAFWQSGNISRGLKPDILLIPKDGSDKKIVIDTKWKTPKNRTPSDQDLRQIFAYNKLFRSQKGILLYPGDKSPLAGNYTIDDYAGCSSEFVNLIDVSGNLKSSFDFSSMLERNESTL